MLAAYSNAKEIKREIAAVAPKQLRQWAYQGHVRTAKLGSAKQSARLYNVQDVVDVIERIAHGRLPTRKVRRTLTADAPGACVSPNSVMRDTRRCLSIMSRTHDSADEVKP